MRGYHYKEKIKKKDVKLFCVKSRINMNLFDLKYSTIVAIQAIIDSIDDFCARLKNQVYY